LQEPLYFLTRLRNWWLCLKTAVNN
jgi:hypothetical protein